MKRFSITRRTFLASSIATVAATSLRANAEENLAEVPGVISSTTYPETSSSLTIKDPSRFKMLQFTDSHFFHGRKEDPNGYFAKAGINRDQRSVDDWKRIVDLHKPDLIAHTGDCWHDNPDNRGAEFQAQSIEWISSLGVPFIYVWGNHDQLPDVPKGHDAWHDAKHSLYRGGPSSGNYTVDILNSDGKRVFELFCVNTHRYGLVGTARDWVKAQAAARSQATEPLPPSMLFHHIPTAAYIDALKTKSAGGTFLEKICNEQEQGAAFPEIKALKTVKACFCGHDHTNDISGVVDDIELVYGRSSGWNGYGWETVRKGGKLITVNCENGKYAWESVFSDGLTWQPKRGKVIDKALDEPFMRDPMRDEVRAS